jgi:hypothetical protein
MWAKQKIVIAKTAKIVRARKIIFAISSGFSFAMLAKIMLAINMTMPIAMPIRTGSKIATKTIMASPPVKTITAQ